MALFLTSKLFSEIHALTMGWKYGYPEMSVIIEKRPHSLPPSGKVRRAVRSGRHHIEPKRQWKDLSLKYSELYASASIVTIWIAAEGAVRRLLSSVLKLPTRFRVRVR